MADDTSIGEELTPSTHGNQLPEASEERIIYYENSDFEDVVLIIDF